MVSPDSVITGDFENGEEALCFIRQNREKAEILLTDVKMPEMDGLDWHVTLLRKNLGRKSSLYLDMMNLNMQKRQCLSVSAII